MGSEAAETKKKQFCTCGCGEVLGSRNKSGFRIGHELAAETRLIRQGCVQPKAWVTCWYCLDVTPKLTDNQKFCSEELTGRRCRERGTELKSLGIYSAKARKQKLFRRDICLKPTTCRYYTEGSGCPPWVVPCTDRWGEPWEWEKLSPKDQEARACWRKSNK